MHCPFLVDIHQAFSGMTKTMSHKKFLKSYLVVINEEPGFFLANVGQKVALLQNYDELPSTLTLTLALEC